MISSIVKFRQLSSWSLFSILAFIASLSLASCDNKEEPSSPAVKTLDITGVYTLKKATLNEKLLILEKGTDITALFKDNLFSKITCKNENNLAIDLRKDKSLYVSCVGESNDLQGGTWNLPHNDTLVLNLNDKLVKAPFALTITDLKVEDDKITGNLVTPMEVGGISIIVKAHIEFHPFKEEAETPDDSRADSIPGLYTLEKATLNEGIPTLEKGADITTLLKGSFFSKITCKNENNLAIDLRKDKSLYVSCVGESNDLQGGTWSLPHNDTLVVLSLNLNDALVQLPVTFAIIDPKIEDGKITGTLVTPKVVAGNVVILKAHIEFHPFKEDEGTETSYRNRSQD